MEQSKITATGFKRLKNFNRVTLAAIGALALGLWTPNMAAASVIGEIEPNNSGATAQNNLNGNFTLDADANITSSTTIPHVSIRATGDGTYDFYRFHSDGGLIIIDVDLTPAGGAFSDNDTELILFNAAGLFQAANDDGGVLDPGSNAGGGACGPTCNSFISGTFGLGDYIVAVCRFSCFDTGAPFGIDGNALTQSGFYTLHISTANDTVPAPEPSTMILLGSGLAGLGAYSRRRNAKKS